MLDLAKKRFARDGLDHVTVKKGNCAKLPFRNESFDAVLSIDRLNAVEDKREALSEMTRVLKKNGRLIGCFYIEGRSGKTDRFVKWFLMKKGWFKGPFETQTSFAVETVPGLSGDAFPSAWIGRIFLCSKAGKATWRGAE